MRSAVTHPWCASIPGRTTRSGPMSTRWSSTRPELDLSLRLRQSQPEPCLSWETPQPLSDDELGVVVDHLGSKDRLPNREVLLNDLLSLMACHAAVRAGDRLTPEEIAALVAQRHLADDTHHCPHGRPTALLFSRHDLERQFRRV